MGQSLSDVTTLVYYKPLADALAKRPQKIAKPQNILWSSGVFG
jgi:hypothetical protein